MSSKNWWRTSKLPTRQHTAIHGDDFSSEASKLPGRQRILEQQQRDSEKLFQTAQTAAHAMCAKLPRTSPFQAARTAVHALCARRVARSSFQAAHLAAHNVQYNLMRTRLMSFKLPERQHTSLRGAAALASTSKLPTRQHTRLDFKRRRTASSKLPTRQHTR